MSPEEIRFRTCGWEPRRAAWWGLVLALGLVVGSVVPLLIAGPDDGAVGHPGLGVGPTELVVLLVWFPVLYVGCFLGALVLLRFRRR
ncbi:MAG: hypothetical protein NTV23_12345 [Propionibacteriales bacterium]|nr:hypothetical protein [Propionibacteriales bacterium]